jgi:hypothetical protein
MQKVTIFLFFTLFVTIALTQEPEGKALMILQKGYSHERQRPIFLKLIQLVLEEFRVPIKGTVQRKLTGDLSGTNRKLMISSIVADY